MPSEHEIQSAILEWLDLKGIFSYRQNTGAAKLKGQWVKFGVRGAPDIIAVKNGRFIGIEVKKPGGIQSTAQASFAWNLIGAGGYYILAYSLDDVISGFAALDT
jgi:hypothetical protein